MNKALKQSSTDLSEYKKTDDKSQDKHTRSVLIFQRHADFLEREKLNLSKMIRDYLDDLIKQKSK